MVLVPSKRRQLNRLVYFTGEKIYRGFNQESTDNYMRVCEKNALNLLSSTIQKCLILCLGTSLFVLFPMVAFVFNNEIQLPVPVLFPFTNIDSVNGLVINMLNQLLIAFVAVSGNIGIEIRTCVLKNSIGVIAAATCHSIDELSEKLKRTAPRSETFFIQRYFRNILIQVQDLDR